MALRRLSRALARPALAVALVAGAAGCSSSTGPSAWALAARGEWPVTFHVAAQRAPCVGMAPGECMQVRTRADEPWQPFHGGIEGFDHEPGYEYVLRVAVREIPDPPADGSSIGYRLLRIVSRTAVAP